MRMLKLDVDALAVESFHTAAAAGARGTVRGAQDRFVVNDTGCTEPCLSEGSWCPIESCGSSCEPACDTTVPVTGHAEPTAG
ncbi:MAG TPA: hypothetical protein VF092_07170 [Longimicrobium sp.]